MRSFAFGKVILLGEHSVVYGHPALAGALSDGVTVETAPGSGRLKVPAWGLDVDAGCDQPTVARAYRAIRERLGVGGESAVDFIVTFAVPTGAGLGSSAAMAVALARAVAEAHGVQATAHDLAGAAMASETEVHGKPSGLDHTVALEGGFGLFTRARGLSPVRAAEPVTLVIGHTGRERDTRGRVARVAELLAERESEVRARFAAIEALVERGRLAVERGAQGELGQAMDENQRHLEALEVSCPEIERMCAQARDAGAVGAKLTGGGGGGCVIAIAPGREPEVRAAWERAGHRAFITTVGAAS
ncbi:MAG TPA: mevalonate kinase [Polyangia bacterium]|jgi:mevalonate kinase